MGGDSPVASPAPRVLYFGPDAERIAAAWNDEDRPFDLVATPATGPHEVIGDTHVDCVVAHSDGESDAAAFVVAVREASDVVPIIVLATADGLSAETAMEIGATYVDLDPDFDPVARLEDVAPVVERHREEVRDRTMLDSLLEQIPLSVYFKDRQSRHVKVSDAMLTMIGPDYIESPDGKRLHSPADVVGLTDYDIYPSGLAETAIADDRTVMDTEEPIVDRIEHSDGNLYEGTYVATSKAPWYDDQGRVIGLVGITRDISERKQYEHQLERQNERLERFAQVISHDLRNPLEVARGRLALARESGDAEEHFGAMERALKRMDALIDDVLTLAREGEVVADPVEVDLQGAATAAWELVDSGDATLEVETEAEILADPGRLQQVFENLFRNAVEHGQGEAAGHDEVASTDEGESAATEDAGSDTEATDDGQVGITITVEELPFKGFAVSDDGVGIPEGFCEEIFEPGFSADDAGTGLGLGIVRTIAEAHGWRVEVGESDAGGARFEFMDVRWAI